MKNIVNLITFACVTAILGSGMASRLPAVADTTGTVQIVYDDWTDTARSRTMPIKLYLPKQIDHPLPVVIFSHGLGGSREAAQYLGDYWAEHGYIGVFIQHPGSDESFWKPNVVQGVTSKQSIMSEFRDTLKNPAHAVNRAQDVHFIVDKLIALNNGRGLLAGKVDLAELAIAGHSFGSWTALTASGQVAVTPFGKTISSVDPRLKAAIYLSPTAPQKDTDLGTVFGDIKIPGLHFTGTKDDSPVNNTKASDRRTAYDNINRSDQYLVILTDADHMLFGGGRKLAQRSGDEKQRQIVEEVSTKFLDAYLKHDKTAVQWLRGPGAKNELSGNGTYEFKFASK